MLAGQKSGIVYGLDPDAKGKVIWKTRVGKGGTNGGVQWGMASDGQRVYASVSDLARIRKDDPLDPRPNAADPKEGGGLTAVRISDGEKAWFAAPASCAKEQPICSPAQPAAVTAISGAVFSGSVDGHMRAFSAEDGKVLWDFDTAQTWQTVNGVFARGGSMDGPGAVGRGRNGVRQFRLRSQRRNAGECSAGLRAVNSPFIVVTRRNHEICFVDRASRLVEAERPGAVMPLDPD